MTPTQAVEIFNQLRLKATLTGAEHDLVMKAIQTLADFVAAHPAPLAEVPPSTP